MSLDEKLRRSAGWAGLLAGALGLAALAGRMTGVDWPLWAGLTRQPMAGTTALCLMLAGASLWLQTGGRTGRAGAVCAAVVLALAAGGLLENLFAVNLGLRDAMFHQSAPSGLDRRWLHTSLALGAIALALLGLGRRRSRDHAGWTAPAWLAAAVTAVAGGAILAVGFTHAGGARPLSVAPLPAAALMALGIGVLLARPTDRHVQLLFDSSPAAVLARRLFLGAAVAPFIFSAALAVLVRANLIDLPGGVPLLVVALVLAGFAFALTSLETAAGLDRRRAGAEQAGQLLTARLQEQAAQLQETVGLRTRELEEVNRSLRAAAESNARLALVAHHTTNGVTVTDATGRIEWVNAAFERMTGHTLADILGRKPGALLQGAGTDPAAIRRIREAGARGESCRVEILNYAKDGRAFWQVAEIQPVRDAAGRVVNFISIHSDVTESHATAQRQQALNQRLRLATRAAALGVWEWDAVANKGSWDDRTLEIYGLGRDQFGGTPEDWTRHLHPEDRERAIGAFRVALLGANEYEQEFRIVRASDGAVRHLQSRAIVQRDPAGQPVRITGTERDVTTEREAAHEMNALNERLRLALRSSNYGVWELDAATNHLVWDDRMFEIYGVQREDFDGSRDIWRSILHPDDRASTHELVRRVIAGEQPVYDAEFRIVRPDGSVRHIEAHGCLQRDADGRVVRLVGLNRDITAEKNMQQALELAEQRWQLAVEGSNDSVWDWNIETGFMFHDARWAHMLGYEPAEIDGTVEGWKQLAHPDDLAANEAAVEEHFAQRTPFYRHELRMRAKSGEWRWILDRGKVVSRAPDGRPLRMAGTHADMTVRKQLEQRLRQVENISDQVSRLALIGGWELDLETSHLTWSVGLRHIHDVDETFQPTVASTLEFYPPEARETLRGALREARARGTPIDLKLPLTTARSRSIWVRVLGEADLVQGRPVRLHGAMQDITIQHESEEARHHLEMQLFQAQKMETLGTLAGGIAHDFNNLLTGIIGYHELAADSLPADHPAHQCLTEARNASLRARELVEQILTFGRQSTGVEHGPLDLVLVIEEARRFLRATLPAMITIELKCAPDAGHVLGDATQIHQVILNLGSNAAHAMRQHGGTLKIELAAAELGDGEAAALGGVPTGLYARLSVSDTGHGMDEATRRRIFDPFFTTKNTREGTGLGLAVVHGIVRAHRGAIAVDSTPGSGATFHVYLPTVSPEDQHITADSTAAPRGRGQMVCVVDDEEIVGSCTKLVLESRGYRTAVFGSGEHCLAAMTAESADCHLLLTDQTMPGIQGTELAAAMRKRYPALPVVIMSGYFSKISPEALDELGQVELLAKPFTTDELGHAVHRALHPVPVA
mgnify:CR=1 FL=1